MGKTVELFLTNIELIKLIKAEPLDCVDRLLEKNGVLYNTPEDLDYQEEHESSIDYSCIGEGI